jgi:hypothetical protein
VKLKASFVSGFVAVFLSLVGNGQSGAFADAAPLSLATAPADEFDDEDDEDEEEDEYQDRVRQMQTWLNKRQAERRQTEGGQAPNPGASGAYPGYFERHGYDEQGYRRIDDDLRIRLRDEPPSYYVSGHSRRHHGHHARRGYRHYRRGGGHAHVQRERGPAHGRHARARTFAPAGRHAHSRSPVHSAPKHAGGKSGGVARARSRKR